MCCAHILLLPSALLSAWCAPAVRETSAVLLGSSGESQQLCVSTQ